MLVGSFVGVDGPGRGGQALRHELTAERALALRSAGRAHPARRSASPGRTSSRPSSALTPPSPPRSSRSISSPVSPSRSRSTSDGVVAERRRRRPRADRRRRSTAAARRQIAADARLIERGEQRVVGHLRVGDDVGEGAVALPQDRRRRQRRGDLLGGVVGEPHREQPGERVAVPVPLTLVGEVRAERLTKCGNGFRRSGDLGQIAEVPAGERDDHEGAPSRAGELLAVLAEDRVADPLAAPRR